MVTDLIELPGPSGEAGFPILGKCEYQQPSGSVKHRTARGMIEAAIATGALRPGDTVVEATAGNTGIGLAHIAPEYDLSVVIFMYQGSPHKAQRIRELGARVFEIPQQAPDHPDSKVNQCLRFRDRMQTRVWYADQYNNPANARAHHHTAQEIFEQRPDVQGIACTVGTGGTLRGIQQWCDQHRPQTRICRIESQPNTRAEGIGTGTPSTIRDGLTPTDQFTVEDREAFRWMRGGEWGPSAAINIEGAVRLAQRIKAPVATVLCDSRSFYPDFIE